jgi:hypothetical protein
MSDFRDKVFTSAAIGLPAPGAGRTPLIWLCWVELGLRGNRLEPKFGDTGGLAQQGIGVLDALRQFLFQ